MASIPPLPAGYNKHHIVYLEAVHCPLPQFNFEYDLTSYQRTQPLEVAERIKTATIIIATVCPVTSSDLQTAPHVRLLAVLATGMGWVDKPYCAQRNIIVVNCPQSNVEALGEHFLSLYFASRRKICENHYLVTRTQEWVEKGSVLKRWPQGPPLSCAKETLGIIGYGSLGRRFEGLAKAVGFGKIIVSDRKGVTEAKPGRVTFNELIGTATTIVVCCPLDASTVNLIDEPELKTMKEEVLLINMARGGIVNEAALAQALKDGRIFGAATDVLAQEPGGPGTSPLLPDVSEGQEPIPRLIVSPHVAWFAERTVETLLRLLKEGVEGFVEGDLREGEGVKYCVAVLDGQIWK